MTPEERARIIAREWIKIGRDLAIVCAGVWVIVHEIIGPFRMEAIGVGLLLLGVPPALRYDRRGKAAEGEEDA